MAKQRYAFNHLVVEHGNVIPNGIVEIEGDKVVSFYHFDHEVPFTQWIGGTVTIRKTPAGLLAFMNDNKQLVADN